MRQFLILLLLTSCMKMNNLKLLQEANAQLKKTKVEKEQRQPITFPLSQSDIERLRAIDIGTSKCYSCKVNTEIQYEDIDPNLF